jgi:hypothetical protein
VVEQKLDGLREYQSAVRDSGLLHILYPEGLPSDEIETLDESHKEVQNAMIANDDSLIDTHEDSGPDLKAPFQNQEASEQRHQGTKSQKRYLHGINDANP